MKQYWHCMIGPVETKDLHYYGDSMDFPYREAIKKIHENYFGTDYTCSSGWGMSETKFRILEKLIGCNDSELRQVLNTLEKIKHDRQT